MTIAKNPQIHVGYYPGRGQYAHQACRKVKKCPYRRVSLLRIEIDMSHDAGAEKVAPR